jgi:Tol biopolymer transport system component
VRWLPARAATTILALIAAPAVLVPSAAPAAPRSKGTLVMISSNPIGHPGFASVSLIDVAGGSSRVVLHGKDDICCSIAWSPDGRWIALAKLDGVVLLARNGSRARALPQLGAGPALTGSARSFAWAPNSRTLAINEGDGHRLVIRGIDGGARVIRRTGKTIVMFALAWSPDGRWISYDRGNLGGANGAGCCSMSLHLIHPDGSGDHTVAVMHEPIHDAPSAALWTHDGHRFAFSTDGRDTRDPRLARVDADSGVVTALPVPITGAFPLGWSPDGSELAAVEGGERTSVVLLDLAGQSRSLTTALPPQRFAGAWSPDGHSLVIACAAPGSGKVAAELELVDVAGGPPRALTQLPLGTQVGVIAWRPGR